MRTTLIIGTLVLSSVLSFSQATTPRTKTIYFSATKKGKAVALVPEQLEMPATIRLKTLKSLGRPPISYIVALDMSNSERERFRAQLNLAKGLLSQVIRPQVDTGFVVAFDTRPVTTPMTQDPTTLIGALDQFRPGGGSAIYDSLAAGVQALVRQAPEQPRVLFLISDGDDNVSHMALSDTVAALVSSNVRVFSLYLNPLPATAAGVRSASVPRGERVLRFLADQTGGEFLQQEIGQRFDEGLARLNATLASSYSGEFEFPAGENPGLHPFPVRSHEKGVNLRIAASYVVEK